MFYNIEQMEEKYSKKKWRMFTFIYKKNDEKYVDVLKKAIQVIEIISPEIYRKDVRKKKYVFIYKSSKLETSLGYKKQGVVVIPTNMLESSLLLWNAGALVHEARHITQPKNKQWDFYWCEMNATKGEMEFYADCEDGYYYDLVNPKTKRKKYFEVLKKRQGTKSTERSPYTQLKNADNDLKEIDEALRILI